MATPHGLLAEFISPSQILEAAERCRDAGFTKWDTHTPYPVHGLDEAMGIRATILPWLVLGGGITGAVTGLVMQWYTNAFDYKFIVSGKPFFSLPANIPVIFELTVLLSAVGAVVWMLILNGLPQWYHPLFKNDRFLRATTDRFFIVIEARDPKFHAEKTREFLESLKPAAIEPLED